MKRRKPDLDLDLESLSGGDLEDQLDALLAEADAEAPKMPKLKKRVVAKRVVKESSR